MKNFLRKGDTVTKTVSGTIVSGKAYALGDRAGIALKDGSNGDSIEFLVEGTVRYAKTNVAMSVGEKLYFDAADDNAQKEADGGTNKAFGWAASDAASGDAEVDVKLGAF